MAKTKHYQKHKKKAPPQADPDALFHKMTTRHMDLLQNVEFAIVRAAKQDPDIDDLAVIDALKHLIAAEEPENERTVDLMTTILEIEDLRPAVDERLWTDAYKVVLDSVYTHSTLQPGNKGYLEFIAPYVP